MPSNPPKYLCKECAGEKEVEKHRWGDIFLEDCAVYDKKIAEEYTTLEERITNLEKEADDYADKHAFRVPYDGSNKFYDDVDFKTSKEGYLAGAKPREKKIEELKIQNAKDRDIASKTQEQLIKAKEIIRDVLTNGNYSLNWKVKAEQFLKEEY